MGEFKFNIPVHCQSLFLLLEQVDKLSVLSETRHLPGVYCKPDGCYFSDENFCFTVYPEQRVFSFENVIATKPRPDLLPNLWISDPEKGLPQQLNLSYERPVNCSQVELIFDTNLDKKHCNGPAVEAVKDYNLEVKSQGKWINIAQIRNNYQRVRRHKFDEIIVEELKLTILSTNGDKSARVYNIRLN